MFNHLTLQVCILHQIIWVRDLIAAFLGCVVLRSLFHIIWRDLCPVKYTNALFEEPCLSVQVLNDKETTSEHMKKQEQ